MTIIIYKIEELRELIKSWKKQDDIIGFIPTMGALHLGHESLIVKANEHCSRKIVSIFVNPIQFGPSEDFDKYPRQMEADRQICERNTVDVIFAPDAKEMYSEQDYTAVLPPDSFQNKLCGKTRTGHFNGVATVVLKLLNIVQPDKAYFGQKDAQQLAIIKKMVRDLNIPVEIIGCPIVRDADGLALSSRNAYLSDEQREKALTINKVLKTIENGYKIGTISSIKLIEDSLPLLHPELKLEYIESVDLKTLQNVDIIKDETLIAIAVKLGEVRLIDNLII